MAELVDIAVLRIGAFGADVDSSVYSVTRLTRLEISVLDALADELRDQLPDLPGQIAEALVGVRRNTGSGFFTEVIVDRSRPSPDSVLTGRFGTIHGDVPGLIEPMAFQVELAAGRILALHGATYDEPTGHIDFPTARVSGLFRIDDQGRSIPWSPPPLQTEDSPLRVLQRSDEPARPTYAGATLAPPRTTLDDALEGLFGKRGAPEPVPAPTPEPASPKDGDKSSPVALVLIATAVIAVIAVLFFRVSFVFALIAFGWVASLLSKPKARAALRRLVDEFETMSNRK